MFSNIAKITRDFFALFTQAKSFKDNRVIGNRLLNRLGLHVFRIVIAHIVIRLRQLWVYFLVRKIIDKNDKKHFFEYGYIIKYEALSDKEILSIRKEFDGQQSSMSSEFQGDTLTRLHLLSDIDLEALPATKVFIDNRNILALLQFCSGFFLRPWLYFLEIENGARPNAKHRNNQCGDPQKLAHADAFHPTMKAWLFLEDVTEKCGPFMYYPKSQRLTLKRLKWEYHRSVNYDKYHDGYSEKGSFRANQKELKQFNIPPPISFNVPANTLIIANTFGFHCRGAAEANTSRRSLWLSAWRAPFLPIPLPNNSKLKSLFDLQMKKRKNQNQ